VISQCCRMLKYIMNNLACKPAGDSMRWIRCNANNRILEDIPFQRNPGKIWISYLFIPCIRLTRSYYI
jgi:hypothetical protein